MDQFSEKVVAESVDFLVSHYMERPSISFLASRAGYEDAYFQKLFKSMVGISPKRLIQYLHVRHANELLESGLSTNDVAFDSKLSGTKRVYDLFVSCQGVAPGEEQHKGKGLKVSYGFFPSPLGQVLIGKTTRGVCYLGFLVEESREEPLRRMKSHLCFAEFDHNNNKVKDSANQVLSIWHGKSPLDNRLKLDLHGTNLQIQIWKALLQIPLGSMVSYKDIAHKIGRPKSARAVGNAVGANPVSLIIPCHRVILRTGIIDNYGWGSPRKKLILGLEKEQLTSR